MGGNLFRLNANSMVKCEVEMLRSHYSCIVKNEIYDDAVRGKMFHDIGQR